MPGTKPAGTRPTDAGDGTPTPSNAGTHVTQDAEAPSSPADAPASKDGSAASPSFDTAPIGPAIAEQKAVSVFWIEVDKKPIVADVKTPGRLKVFEDPGATHDGLATRAPDAMLPIGISLRGNYSLGLPKKPYALEVQDGAGAEKPAPLLGLPAEADWVLNASYTDHTFLRNPLTYTLMQEMGHYASRFRFVEIYLDGAYQGLYILLEKPNRGRYRVNIPKPAAKAADGDLTGGYIFRLEGAGKGGARDFKSSANTLWTYAYPPWDTISADQKTYLLGAVNRFEALMASDGYADPVKGYPSMIDVASFVDYALIEEFCMNFDSYWKSARLHKQSDPNGGKIFAGPIWDFDNAYGMADFASGTTGRLQVNLPKFWVRLWADPTFRRDLKCRWSELRKRTITMENIDAKVNKWAKLIAAADARDNAKWKTIGAKVPLVKYIGPDYDSYLQYMRTWIMKRLAWLDPDYAKFPGTCN